MNSLYHRQILFLILLFLAFLFIIGALIYSSSLAATLDESDSEESSKKKLIRYRSDEINISRIERIEADIVIHDGTLTIGGEIYGDVVAFQSDVFIEHSGTIYGNVICYLGEIKKDEGAKIGGDMISVGVGKRNFISKTECRNIEGHAFPYHLFTAAAVEEKEPARKYIEANETITGDVIIIDDSMTIDGKVDGDIIGLASDIEISDSAAIDGHVITCEGTIDISEDALITGKLFDCVSKRISLKDRKGQEDEDKIRDEVEKKFLKHKKRSEVVRFFGDVTIEEDEVINGEVVIMRGTAHVKGEVSGDVVAVFGNIELDSTGYVGGDVVSVGGRIYREKGSFVGGDVVQTSWTGVKVDEGDQHVEVGVTGVRVRPKKEDDWRKRKIMDRWQYDDYEELENFMFRYNRVEGLFLGLRSPRYYETPFHVSVYGHAGYGFKNKRARYQLGLERWFFDNFRFIIGGEIHDITDTQDSWIMSPFENSLAAILFKEDFNDYYRSVGASGYVAQNFTPDFRLTVGYKKDRYYNMEKMTDWSIFGGKKKFRMNPFVDELEIQSYFLELGIDTRNSVRHPTQGWLIKFLGEFAGTDLNKDYAVDFDRFIVDLRRYQPIGYGENLDFRLRMGTARGELPIQFQYDLGGISTLRGYQFKEFENGDRMILGNVEYRIYGREKGWLLDDLNLILFADAGWVWNADDKSAADKSFGHLDWEDLKTSAGVALSNHEGSVRLTFAQRFDDRDKPVVITFRIRRPF